MNILKSLALAAATIFASAAPGMADEPTGYPGNYAKAPRFNALIYYSDTAEEAHVVFANQAIDFFNKLTVGNGYNLTTTTSLKDYPYEKLKEFDVMIVINASPQDPKERAAFEKYMENGGGWVGFHAAGYSDQGTKWPWFNEFLGAGTFLCNSWPPQPVMLDVETSAHPVTKNLPSSFVAPACEWYMWNNPARGKDNIDVLLSVSPKNYPLGLKDVISFGDFPIVWTNRNYRMIYLNIGHGDVEFTDATQNLLVVNALRWIVSRSPKGDPFKIR